MCVHKYNTELGFIDKYNTEYSTKVINKDNYYENKYQINTIEKFISSKKKYKRENKAIKVTTMHYTPLLLRKL